MSPKRFGEGSVAVDVDIGVQIQIGIHVHVEIGVGLGIAAEEDEEGDEGPADDGCEEIEPEHRIQGTTYGLAAPSRRRTGVPRRSSYTAAAVELFLSALLIFLLRLTDVSLGTVRIVLLTRGSRRYATLLGFFESLIWVIAAGQVVTNVDDPVRLLAFASGFAAGTLFGATVERWLAIGSSIVRIVTSVGSPEVAPALREHGFQVTVLNAEGMEGDVRLAFTVVPRRRQREVLRIVREVNPEAFVTMEQTTPMEATRTLVRR